MATILHALLPTNVIPQAGVIKNDTGCCQRFDPGPWQDQELHFEEKPFVKASTNSFLHVPLNMRPVFTQTWNAIKEAHAEPGGQLVLSHDRSPWHAEHLFAVSGPVPGAQMVYLSGNFLTKVFEGPYSDARKWCAAMMEYVQASGRQLETLYFFYSTCPRCAKQYGKNYVVGIAKVA